MHKQSNKDSNKVNVIISTVTVVNFNFTTFGQLAYFLLQYIMKICRYFCLVCKKNPIQWKH